MTVTIRRATPADAGVLAEFNIAMAQETEGHALDPAVIGPGVLRVVAEPSKGLYFVAEESGRVVGQTMVTFEWSDWRNGDLWWLQSVYVHTDFRGRGVFRALHDHVEREARAARAVGLRLYVHDANTRAQETYRRLGWRYGDYLVFERMF